MARPVKCRRICREPAYDSFAPQGIPGEGKVLLSLDEYETIRLIDYEKCTQEQCAEQMEVSRPTVTSLYENARGKIADCMIHGKTLQISGGQYRLCQGSAQFCCHRICDGWGRQTYPDVLTVKGEQTMRIAVTYENGQVFQHFGHTEQFKVYDAEAEKIVEEQVIDTNGQGHGALAGFLQEAKVDILICGGIGGGAQAALKEAGIAVYGGVTGEADDAVKAFLNKSLVYNPNVMCSHHGHGEGHSCGEHKNGCAGH